MRVKWTEIKIKRDPLESDVFYTIKTKYEGDIVSSIPTDSGPHFIVCCTDDVFRSVPIKDAKPVRPSVQVIDTPRLEKLKNMDWNEFRNRITL